MDVVDTFWACKLLLHEKAIENPPPSQLPYDCAKITKNLYIGSMYSIHPDSLLYHKFDAIINASSEIEVEVEAFQTHTNYMKIDINDCDTEFICAYFKDTNTFIESNQKVLVHCAAGISRSASFVLAYLVGCCNFSLLDAIRHVKSRRSMIHPNDSFLVQLILYEHCLKRDSTHELMTETLWRDTMNLLGLCKNSCDGEDKDVPTEWKSLYKLGFSSSYKNKET